MEDTPQRQARRNLLKTAPAAAVALAAGAAQAQPPASAPAHETPGLTLAFTAHVQVAPTRTIGDIPGGQGRIVPITGGTFEGPKLRGKVMAGGADWQTVRPDGVTELRAHYGLECDDGTIIQVLNQCVVAVQDGKRLIRSTLKLEAPKGAHEWLNKAVFVGTLNAPGDAQAPVVIRCFQVT